MEPAVPARLVEACRGTPERAAWLRRLPAALVDLSARWSLTLEPPFDSDEVSASWVAPAVRADGSAAVLKLSLPHFEGAGEIAGLRFWNGDPTVRLLEADHDLNAMLLERCEPGAALRSLPEPEQDTVIAGLLQRLWRPVTDPHPFRSLADLTRAWSEETASADLRWPDPGLVREGLRLFAELPRSGGPAVLLATDLHAGNVLTAAREPWLVIDPKPFVGDPAYDATQHLFNCEERLATAPGPTIRRLAQLCEVDERRLRLWLFARAAAEPRTHWTSESLALARALAP